MKLPENDYQILQLSDEFYDKYKSPPYQEILKKNIRETDTKNIYLFTGIIDCPCCGKKLSATRSGNQSVTVKGKTYNYDRTYYSYRCNTAYINKACEWKRRPNEEKIESALLSHLESMVTGYIEASKIEDATIRDSHASDKIKDIEVTDELDLLIINVSDAEFSYIFGLYFIEKEPDPSFVKI